MHKNQFQPYFFLQKSSKIKLLPTISFLFLYHLDIAHYFLVLDFTLGKGTAVISFMVVRQQTKNRCWWFFVMQVTTINQVLRLGLTHQ